MKLIENYPEYSISRDGRVFSHLVHRGPRPALIDYSVCKELKAHKNHRGYLQIKLMQKDPERVKIKTIHRLVAEAYIENPNNLDTVNHINEDKLDNRVENLEWMSNADNIDYSQAKVRLIETPTGELITIRNLQRWAGEVLGNRNLAANMYRSLREEDYRVKGYKLLK